METLKNTRRDKDSILNQFELFEALEAYLGHPDDETSIASYKKVMELDESERYPEELVQELLSFGLASYYVPKSLGGKLVSYEQLLSAARVLGRRGLSTAVTLSTSVWSTIVWVGGSDEQKRRCAALTQSIHGGQCLAYSEEKHGADLIANDLLATEVENGYILNGNKWPINRAARSDIVMLLAKTADRRGARNLSIFMVEKSELDVATYSYLPKVKSLGLRGCDICGIDFHGAKIDKSALIGNKGEGLDIAIKALQITRTLCTGLSIGAVENGLRVVTDFALERNLYKGKLIDIPNARRVLSKVFANLLVSDALSTSLVRSIHFFPEQLSVLSAVGKYHVPNGADADMKKLASVQGARFFLREKHKEGIFQKSLRDGMVVGLFDGSSEVNLYSLSVQLHMLAKRQKKLLTSPPSCSDSRYQSMFDLSVTVPPMEYSRLDLSNHAKDTLMESFPLIQDKLQVDVIADSVDKELLSVLHSQYLRLRSLYTELIDKLCRTGENRISMQSPELFQLAREYCIYHAAVSTLQIWLHNRNPAGAPAFFDRPAWVVAGLSCLLEQLHDTSIAVPENCYEAIARELIKRTRKNTSYSLIPLTLPTHKLQLLGEIA